MQIETERLYLRKFDVEKDLKAYAEIMDEYEVGKWLPKGKGYTLEESERLIMYMIAHWHKYSYGPWAVIEKDTDLLVGQCGLNFVKDLGETEILYAFGKNARGKGYATESGKAVLEYGFKKIGLDHIIGLTKIDNIASMNVLKKLGLKYIKNIEIFNMEATYFDIVREEYEKLII